MEREFILQCLSSRGFSALAMRAPSSVNKKDIPPARSDLIFLNSRIQFAADSEALQSNHDTFIGQ